MDDNELDDLLRSLAASAERISVAARSVPADRWEEPIQTGDGAWTRRQLLSHMAANDLRQLVRVRIGAGIPEPGDGTAHQAEMQTHDWNQARVEERAGRGVAELLTEMETNRGALMALLRSLSPEQRDRPMPFRGQPTALAQMVPTLIGHLDQHAQELISGLGE